MAISRIGEYRKEPVPTPLAPATRASVSAVLKGIRDLVEAFDYPALPALREEITQCQTLLESNADATDLESAITTCMESSRRATAHILAQRAAEQREAAALVTAVREAVATISADTSAFRADVQRSTERFEEIANDSPVLELQARLKTEVQVLKTTVARTQTASRKNNEALNQRIASLEVQLHTARQESDVDALTGVSSRGAFDRACQEWMKNGLRRFSLLMVDVDDFKSINDTRGHVEGDRVLAAVGSALKRGARSNQDFVARIGGDEFAILAQDVPLAATDGLFVRIVGALDSQNNDENSPIPPLTLSCGAAEFSAGDTIRSLMQRADEALYDAKRRGKHRVVTKAKPFLRDL